MKKHLPEADRRSARRYDLSLPVIIRVPLNRESASHTGKTRDISTTGVSFNIDSNLSTGTELDLTVTLPAEVTGGTEVFIRAMGKVVRVDKRSAGAGLPTGVVATMRRYEMVRSTADAPVVRRNGSSASKAGRHSVGTDGDC